jgi:hypothetical protein
MEHIQILIIKHLEIFLSFQSTVSKEYWNGSITQLIHYFILNSDLNYNWVWRWHLKYNAAVFNTEVYLLVKTILWIKSAVKCNEI